MVSPTHKNNYYIKHKNNNYESIIKLNKNGTSFDINFNKGRNKSKNIKEKISLISKDKDLDDITSSIGEDNKIKGRNIIIKKDNKIIKQLIEDNSNNNNIDISIQFTDKRPQELLYGRNTKRYPTTAKRKIIKKNLKESLYKDLQEINNKLKNKDDFFKNYYHAQYQRHIGDCSTCPLCIEMKKKGILSERQKGLHGALSTSGNVKSLNRRNFSKIKIALNSNGKENNNNLNIFSTSNIAKEFNNKYLQFNGFHRPNKLSKLGSFTNLLSFRNDNENKRRTFRNISLFKNKELEKNKDDFDRWQLSSLSQYYKK